MNKILLFFFLLFVTSASFAQKRYPSSCDAQDNIKALYRTDADRMALRKVYKTASNYLDSTTIPKHWSDSILRSLIAVYNVDSIPARDTVVLIAKIHTLDNPVINRFYLGADSTRPWMQNLKNNIFPTNNDTVDFMLKIYKLSVLRYYSVKTEPYHIVIFESTKNFNFEVISNLFDSLGGVHYSNRYTYDGDGSDIQATYDTTFTDLIYSFGWDDCANSCNKKRFWKFRVHNTCEVEYLGSYGRTLSPGAIRKIQTSPYTAYPNPFKSQIQLRNLKTDSEFTLISSIGQVVLTGKTKDSTIPNLEALPAGMYLLQLKTEGEMLNYHLQKQE